MRKTLPHSKRLTCGRCRRWISRQRQEICHVCAASLCGRCFDEFGACYHFAETGDRPVETLRSRAQPWWEAGPRQPFVGVRDQAGQPKNVTHAEFVDLFWRMHEAAAALNLDGDRKIDLDALPDRLLPVKVGYRPAPPALDAAMAPGRR